jgi:hypothetical protein
VAIMKYFKVTVNSAHFCGFDYEKVFAAENEIEFMKSNEYLNMVEDVKDNIYDAEEEDCALYDGEFVDDVEIEIKEITEEEYLEEKEG